MCVSLGRAPNIDRVGSILPRNGPNSCPLLNVLILFRGTSTPQPPSSNMRAPSWQSVVQLRSVRFYSYIILQIFRHGYLQDYFLGDLKRSQACAKSGTSTIVYFPYARFVEKACAAIGHNQSLFLGGTTSGRFPGATRSSISLQCPSDGKVLLARYVLSKHHLSERGRLRSGSRAVAIYEPCILVSSTAGAYLY